VWFPETVFCPHLPSPGFMTAVAAVPALRGLLS
jgi:hypothetical protein